jgi:hypothetical protein
MDFRLTRKEIRSKYVYSRILNLIFLCQGMLTLLMGFDCDIMTRNEYVAESNPTAGQCD